MSGWELSLVADPQRELDGAALSRIATCTHESQIARLPMASARTGLSFVVSDLFRIRQCTADSIVIQGNLSFLHCIGSEWSLRSLLIEGSVGSGLGVNMRSGQIEVRGHTAAYAAQQLRGGTLRIQGDTGDYLGAPLPGRRSGMSGGRVIVSGHAGHHAGHRMRRGVMLVAGQCGAGVASDMVAGTIAIGGEVGERVAAGMKRGTLILARRSALDTRRFACSRPSPLGITRLLAADFRKDVPQIAAALAWPAQRFLGDRSCGGQGEIWQLQNPSDGE